MSTIPPRIKKIPAAKQRLLDELLTKNASGEITKQEAARLRKLVDFAESLMVENAERLSEFTEQSRSPIAAAPVPVTVWVHPDVVKP